MVYYAIGVFLMMIAIGIATEDRIPLGVDSKKAALIIFVTSIVFISIPFFGLNKFYKQEVTFYENSTSRCINR